MLRHRGSARQRGYDRRWELFAKSYLERNPLCVDCQRRGQLTPAAQVDHINPLRQGGAKFDEANLQALCGTCHSSKTAREMHGQGPRGCNTDGVPTDPRHHWSTR